MIEAVMLSAAKGKVKEYYHLKQPLDCNIMFFISYIQSLPFICIRC